MPSNHLILCHPPSPPALSLSQHQVLFKWVSSFEVLYQQNYLSLVVGVVLVTQSCPILCDPMDCSLPGSSLGKNTGVGCHFLLQAPLSMDSSGKNPGVGCHFLLQGLFPNPGVKPRSPASHMDSLPYKPLGKPVGYKGWVKLTQNIKYIHKQS